MMEDDGSNVVLVWLIHVPFPVPIHQHEVDIVLYVHVVQIVLIHQHDVRSPDLSGHCAIHWYTCRCLFFRKSTCIFMCISLSCVGGESYTCYDIT